MFKYFLISIAILFLNDQLIVHAFKSLLNTENSPFIINVLDAHNKYRKLHGADPLKYSFILSNKSQAHSEYLAQNEKFVYSMNNVNGAFLGESIAMWNGFSNDLLTTNYDISLIIEAPFPVDLWYAESLKYDYSINEFQPETAHFSQLVWKDTQAIGIGFSKSQTGCYLVVNYYPAGNIDNEFEANVKRKNFKKFL